MRVPCIHTRRWPHPPPPHARAASRHRDVTSTHGWFSRRVVLQVVPMLNPDGVFLGNYRCNSVGLDLNRLWHASVPGTAPTIHAMREAARVYCGHEICRLELVLDMHAHSTCMNGFIFAKSAWHPRPRDRARHSLDNSFSPIPSLIGRITATRPLRHTCIGAVLTRC